VSPPYHLRPNKAVDRFRLIDIINKLKTGGYDLSEYTYIGFGGPFLEDMRLIGNFFPEMSTLSIEEDLQVHNRQQFHIPHKKVATENVSSEEFIDDYTATTKCVFWLDYTDLKPSHFQEFEEVLTKLQPNSIVKITVRADLKDYPPERVRTSVTPEKQAEEEEKFLLRFNTRFGDWTPADLTYESFRSGRFFLVIERMFQIAAQKALPTSPEGMRFQKLDSVYYSDSGYMFCLTGIICSADDSREVCDMLNGVKYANLIWGNPKKIDVPILSTKERLHLERHLPMETSDGEMLHQVLGYNIEETPEESIAKLQQYADFCSYLPYFVKASP
jgi:hypothetical protein